jgi:hypothetical protein
MTTICALCEAEAAGHQQSGVKWAAASVASHGRACAAERLKAERPEIQVLFVSARDNDQLLKSHPGLELMRKPVELDAGRTTGQNQRIC